MLYRGLFSTSTPSPPGYPTLRYVAIGERLPGARSHDQHNEHQHHITAGKACKQKLVLFEIKTTFTNTIMKLALKKVREIIYLYVVPVL